MSRRSLRARLLRRSWLLALATAVAACTLNPQPLPPGEGSSFGGGESSDNGDRFGADAGAATPKSDSGSQGGQGDGGAEVRDDGGVDGAPVGDASDDGATSSDATTD